MKLSVTGDIHGDVFLLFGMTESMSDEELLRSAGLYGKDRATGESGYNLAAVMLLGKDDLIMDICPAYETDALVRRVNVDRYDF